MNLVFVPCKMGYLKKIHSIVKDTDKIVLSLVQPEMFENFMFIIMIKGERQHHPS